MTQIKTRNQKHPLFPLLIGLLFFLTAGTSIFASSELFPRYPEIQKNVSFWKDVYTRYSLLEGVIHDRNQLNIVYSVVELQPGQRRWIRRANKKNINHEKSRIQKILIYLSEGNPAESEEEIRILDLFGEAPTSEVLLEASGNIRYQLGQLERFRRGVERSGAYLEQFKTIFLKYDLPEELVYLPHVESSFNVKAYSKIGASGLWQFIRSTGKRYMKINYSLDERRDPVRATHAAAKLLKRNYKLLGTWPLALTAYNHGAAGMKRAKKESGHYVAIYQEYTGRRFKFASRNFYSQFVAALEVAQAPEEYFDDLNMASPASVYEIKIKSYLPMKEVLAATKLNKRTLQKLNPALRSPVFQNQKYIPKNYYLRLPDNSTVRIAMSEISKNKYKKKQRRSRFYRVQRGDVAGSVARRHGISLRDLIDANNLNWRATIYLGQNLRIPTVAEQKVYVQRQKKEDLKKQKIISVAELTQNSSTSSFGDSTKESVSITRDQPVLSRNQAKSSQIEKVLTTTNPSVVEGYLEIEKTVIYRGREVGVIQVLTNETLGHYADWAQVTAQDIRRLNRIRFGRSIQAGKKIKIPLEDRSKIDFEEARFEHHKAVQEDFFDVYSVENLRSYTVRPGDNIWTLARSRFESPIWLIKKYNATTDLYNLTPSQILLIPIVEKKS